MQVDHYISELLYDHDCVIVPSFGGFLASYRPATIHPTQHVFSPPSKKIAFNVFLKQNDGLLANHLAGHEKLSYSEALNRIEHHVNQWQKELAEGKKLVIERIGVFYLDAEKNLQFEPVKNINYLRNAFGLSTIQFMPVKREDEIHLAAKQLKQAMTNRPSEKQEKQPLKLSKKSKRKILSTLIISGSLLWFSFNLYLITPRHFDLSSLNPFSSKDKTEILKEEVKPVNQKPVTVSPAPVETVFVANVTPATPSEITPEKKENAETKPFVSQAPIVNSSDAEQKYFIIGGAFQIRENADAFVKTLQAEGFADARILDTSEHLKKVCLKGFSTRSDATAELDSLKDKFGSAWIYKM